jgi:protein-tyrosine phosphatase
LIDIHSHLLPNVDDGSRSVQQSVAVLTAFGEAGVTDVVVTPHTAISVLSRHLEDEIEHRDEVLSILRDTAPPVPRLHAGFEIMLDEPPSPGLLADRRVTLAGSRYLLLEARMHERPARIAELLAAAAVPGLVPIVAHPERYWHCSVADIAGWRARGAKLQLDATTLTRYHPRGHRARDLLRAGLADLVAADNHGGRRIVATATAYLERRGYATAARLLVCENPRAVVEDRELTDVGRVGVGTKIGDIVREILISET